MSIWFSQHLDQDLESLEVYKMDPSSASFQLTSSAQGNQRRENFSINNIHCFDLTVCVSSIEVCGSWGGRDALPRLEC